MKADATLALASRRYDAGKKTNGRKRHLLTDTLGLLLAVLVTLPPRLTATQPAFCCPRQRITFGGWRGSGPTAVTPAIAPTGPASTSEWSSTSSAAPTISKVLGPAPPLGRREILRLAPAQLAPGPCLRTAHRHQRERHPVVDDHAHGPPGRPAPASRSRRGRWSSHQPCLSLSCGPEVLTRSEEHRGF
ncbi:hypothetical protein [Streptomyces griseoloalbus]|uniref:hypothetical protein n=1 Tax=Streptomyces griseoloalbus TaxID=67303 RepID=UPI001875575B